MAAIERRALMLRWGRRVAFTGIAAGLVFGSVRGYAAWRVRHLGRQIEEFVQRNEIQSAVLVARRLLDLDRDNLTACRAMAEVADKAARPEAVAWRMRVAHLAPTATNRLAFAHSALRFGQLELAGSVLENAPAAEQQTREFHQVAGAHALATKQLPLAESHFAAAARTSPHDQQLAMNLALVRLASPDETVAASARTTMAAFAGKDATRLQSLRALTADAIAHKQSDVALKWAAQLRKGSGVTFADHLICFEALQGTEAAPSVLADLKAQAATRPTLAAEFITWLNRNSMAIVAVEWASSLPSALTGAQPVPLAIAESHSFLSDWAAMLALVEGKNWGDFEALRHAVETHALRRMIAVDGASVRAKATWRSALDAAKSRPEQLIAIAQLAEGWGYASDAEDAWWLVASGADSAKAGLSALQRLYKAKSDTRGLLRVAKRALELNPADLVAANNVASLSLLLDGDSGARRRAAKLHADHPANHAFAATYAFALQTEGKLPEALQLMETLTPEELRHPDVAAYYVVLLVEMGNMDRARIFLPFAGRATLLPEEKQLLTAAERRLVATGGDSAVSRVAASVTAK